MNFICLVWMYIYTCNMSRYIYFYTNWSHLIRNGGSSTEAHSTKTCTRFPLKKVQDLPRPFTRATHLYLYLYLIIKTKGFLFHPTLFWDVFTPASSKLLHCCHRLVKRNGWVRKRKWKTTVLCTKAAGHMQGPYGFNICPYNWWFCACSDQVWVACNVDKLLRKKT